MKRDNVGRNILLCSIFMCLFVILVVREWIVTLCVIVGLLLFSFPFFVPKIINYFEKKFLMKKAVSDVSNYAEFYRDIIYKYSILQLSMLDGYDIDFPKDIVACLLSLQLKNYIKLSDKKIDILDSNVGNLKESEKCIFNSIVDGKVILKDISNLREKVKDENIKDKLIEKTKYFGTKFIIIMGVVIFIYLVLFFLVSSSVIPVSSSVITIMGYVFASIFLVIWILVSSALVYDQVISDKNRWKLTGAGKEIYVKILGLKNFLSEFSIIDKRKNEELLLWDDYLIYSVMFGLNNNIIDKYKKLIVIENVNDDVL